MFNIDKNQAHLILTTELDYKPHEADLFLKDFPLLHDELSPAVESWFKDRTLANLSIEGLTIQEVMRCQGYHFLLAIKEMNHLFDDDLSPSDRTRLVHILTSPAPHK